MCFVLQTFDVAVSETETTVTVAPAVSLALVVGNVEIPLVTRIDYTSLTTLRLCRVIDAPT